MNDPTLADDLRQAAQNPNSIFPAWVRDELARESDRTEESQERWARWLDDPTTVTTITHAEEPTT